MKKTTIFLITILVIIMTLSFTGCGRVDRSDYLRIHIRANSNSDIDQDVKYEIKGAVVHYLSPYLEGVKSPDEAKKIVKTHAKDIERVANDYLEASNLDYRAHCDIRREHFPLRHYGKVTLDEGDYDAVIVELGKAEGDNWWCVVFPPLCFVKSEEAGDKDFHYVSKIKEIIDKLRR